MKLTDPQIRVLHLVAKGHDSDPGSIAVHHLSGIDQRIAARLGELLLLDLRALRPAHGAGPSWDEWHLTEAGEAARKAATSPPSSDAVKLRLRGALARWVYQYLDAESRNKDPSCSDGTRRARAARGALHGKTIVRGTCDDYFFDSTDRAAFEGLVHVLDWFANPKTAEHLPAVVKLSAERHAKLARSLADHAFVPPEE